MNNQSQYLNKQYQDFNTKIQGLDNKRQSLRKLIPLKTCIDYKQFHRNVTFQEITSNKSPEVGKLSKNNLNSNSSQKCNISADFWKISTRLDYSSILPLLLQWLS